MTLRNQIDAFELAHPDGGLKELKFTIGFDDGRRTPILKGNELRMLETFASIAEVSKVVSVEIDHKTGYYELPLDMLECECGKGMACEKVKVTSYE
jgi:hypothetical protein